MIQKKTNFFWGHPIKKNQLVVCIMGPSGTGKTFSAEFLQEYFGFKIVNQITTRAPRPDDKYYSYINEKDFVALLHCGKIIGYFDKNIKDCGGTGYGYNKDYVFEELKKYNRIILFPSPYELTLSGFCENYKDATIIGLTFQDIKSVKKRAALAKKVISAKSIKQRQEHARAIINIMEKFSIKNDCAINLICSDNQSDNILISKKNQLSQILKALKIDPNNHQEKILKYIGGK